MYELSIFQCSLWIILPLLSIRLKKYFFTCEKKYPWGEGEKKKKGGNRRETIDFNYLEKAYYLISGRAQNFAGGFLQKQVTNNFANLV